MGQEGVRPLESGVMSSTLGADKALFWGSSLSAVVPGVLGTTLGLC